MWGHTTAATTRRVRVLISAKPHRHESDLALPHHLNLRGINELHSLPVHLQVDGFVRLELDGVRAALREVLDARVPVCWQQKKGT